MLPLSAGGLVVVSLITFVWVWGEYLFAFSLAGDSVRVEFGPRQGDRYGRILYYVFTMEGESIDEMLAREGLALAWLEDGQHLRYHDPRRFGCWQWTASDPAEPPLLRQLGPELQPFQRVVGGLQPLGQFVDAVLVA
jgi:hypothetical protein